VAGAGPAGFTAAFYLALLGHDVTVYDAKAEAGACCASLCRNIACPRILRREIELIERLGVKFVFNTRIGFDIR
jgi:NADPH-dependent glutamate synthase beta subunit-like oxidoreductase